MSKSDTQAMIERLALALADYWKLTESIESEMDVLLDNYECDYHSEIGQRLSEIMSSRGGTTSNLQLTNSLTSAVIERIALAQAAYTKKTMNIEDEFNISSGRFENTHHDEIHARSTELFEDKKL
ncbi:hypothetical protein N9137_00990 [Pseudomonadales bacterium]|nr:hypothetical protein [Pseudomonadales bacterium]